MTPEGTQTAMPMLRRPPMWARWALSLGVGVILLVALIVFVEHNNSNSEAVQSPAAVARANREARIVVQQDQVPHTAALKPGAAPRSGIARVVRADMTAMLATGTIEGPLRHVGCNQTGDHSGHLLFRCTAVAGGVNYPFLGVVDVRAGQVTYCKRDEPPVPSMNVPVSSRCTT